jgi:multimeric flavodoxin WrbA
MTTKILVLHDLKEGLDPKLFKGKEYTEFNAFPLVSPCVGCFSCWVKTPGSCIIKDRANVFPSLIADHDELLIISRLFLGSFSPEVKRVIERSLCYVLPFFGSQGKKTVHIRRVKNDLVLKTVFYGEGSGEMVCLAEKLTLANSINICAKRHESHYFSSVEEIELPC